MVDRKLIIQHKFFTNGKRSGDNVIILFFKYRYHHFTKLTKKNSRQYCLETKCKHNKTVGSSVRKSEHYP